MLGWLFSEPLEVGGDAPDFELPDEQGQTVRLSSLRGHNVVLVFYPGDDTMVCRQQMCEFRDHWPEVQSRDTLVFGVNPQSARSHAGFRASRSLPFPLLVDRGRRVTSLYRANGPVVKRTVYLIGKSGKIRFARRGKPSPEEVLAAAE